MKKCYKCQVTKPLYEYHSNKNKSDGRQSCCISCKKLYNASRPSGYNTPYEAKRRSSKLQATPELSTDELKDVRDIYDLAIQMRELGLDVQVDHIDPLQGESICGLHVPSNLTIIPTSANISKSNKFTPYTVDSQGVVTYNT